MRWFVLILVATLVGCSWGDTTTTTCGDESDGPTTDTSKQGFGDPDAGPTSAVDDCTDVPNYSDCNMQSGEIGLCVLGQCVRACSEDVECDDDDACTEDTCHWGHCDNVPVCAAPKPVVCVETSECYFSMCSESLCVDGACVHAAREDGLTCIGVIGLSARRQPLCCVTPCL